MSDDLFNQMTERYRAGNIPWDAPLPPPELMALAAQLPAGRALDLGCGTGRSAIYLAQQGWWCDGIDFVSEAIEIARQRAEAAGVAARLRFHVASVTRLDFLQPPYDLAVDIGCLHGQQGDDLLAYVAEVTRLLRPGAHYLLFTRLRDEPRGPTEPQLRALLAPAFDITRVEQGMTYVGDEGWPSAWLWMLRRGE